MSQNIDKIIYINLNKRPDRREQIENELNNFGLEYERFEAIDVPYFGQLGCAISHLSVLKIARERGYKNILILEDDFTFTVTKDEFENQLNMFFNSNINYNVCMLSYNLNNYIETNYNFIFKALDVQTASGYIVNSNYYDKLINLFEPNIKVLYDTKCASHALDVVWKTLQPNDEWFCFINRIGIQRPGYSNNEGIYVDYGV